MVVAGARLPPDASNKGGHAAERPFGVWQERKHRKYVKPFVIKLAGHVDARILCHPVEAGRFVNQALVAPGLDEQWRHTGKIAVSDAG